jgi:hypothetical protein
MGGEFAGAMRGDDFSDYGAYGDYGSDDDYGTEDVGDAKRAFGGDVADAMGMIGDIGADGGDGFEDFGGSNDGDSNSKESEEHVLLQGLVSVLSAPEGATTSKREHLASLIKQEIFLVGKNTISMIIS